jgi:hypothetical protein
MPQAGWAKQMDSSPALRAVGRPTAAPGNFRNFATVMDELGAKWESLSNREQAYIATSFAG